MIIPLNHNLRIFGGPLAWELQRRKVVKDKDRWESFKWYTNLGQAVWGAGEIEIRLSEGPFLDRRHRGILPRLTSLRYDP